MPDDTLKDPSSAEPVLILAYSRARAIADGTLIDISTTAAEAGFSVPTALTAAAFSECVEWTDDDADGSKFYQDQSGRLWDVVYLAAMKARRLANQNTEEVLYELRVVPRPGQHRPELRTLKLVIGPGDNSEPVATIMLPDED